MVDFEDAERFLEFGPSPWERIQPRPQQDVLRELSALKPILGIARSSCYASAQLATQLTRVSSITRCGDLSPRRSDELKRPRILEDPGRSIVHLVPPAHDGGHHGGTAWRGFHLAILVDRDRPDNQATTVPSIARMSRCRFSSRSGLTCPRTGSGRYLAPTAAGPASSSWPLAVGIPREPASGPRACI